MRACAVVPFSLTETLTNHDPTHIHVVSCLFIDHIIMLHNVPQIEGLGQQERLTDPRATPSLASDPSPAYMYMYVIWYDN